jgi:Protein of unknown function (DUF3999)
MSRKQMIRLHALSLLAALPALCVAAVPRLDDYASGIAIDVADQRPIVQLSVPDGVYQRVVTDDLSDLRVFNADGVPVPHALCAALANESPTISQESLPVYRLQDVPGAEDDGTRVEVQTSSGAQISVQGANGASAAERQTSAYVIDARGVSDALRAMQFDWSSPDGASEVRVSIQASDDLDRWRTIVAGSRLLKVESGAQQLRRHRIAIPPTHYEYLRVERVDRGPPLQIDGVIAERVTPAPILEPMWFAANPVAPAEPNTLEFDAGRRAPFTYARLTPSQDNTSMQVAIESRADPRATWRVQWTGEVYSILADSERRVSPPAEFAPTNSPHWRVRLTKAGETFYQSPALELGYRPANLRFLAQGSGPFTLAYGSRRAEPSPARACNTLLGDLNAPELAQNISDGHAGAVRTLGGEDAFRPLPKQTPLRQIVLWTVLVLGVGALVTMALSLLRRVNPDGKA